MWWSRLVLCIACVVPGALLACDDDNSKDGATPVGDAALEPDANTLRDAAADLDASLLPDGSAPDSSAPNDGAMPKDAEPAEDAALSRDASLGEDAASVDDASMPPDAAIEPPECTIVAPTACVQPAPTYADVQPIFQARCVTCHPGTTGDSWPLNSYSHVVDWAPEIRGAMLDCLMPPFESGMTMPDSERDLILAWLRCGHPL